jgi:hypothetical protein
MFGNMVLIRRPEHNRQESEGERITQHKESLRVFYHRRNFEGGGAHGKENASPFYLRIHFWMMR